MFNTYINIQRCVSQTHKTLFYLLFYLGCLIVGVEGLRLMCFHFLSLGTMPLHSLTAVLMLRCNLLVISWGSCVKLLLEIKVWILLLYSSSYYNIIGELLYMLLWLLHWHLLVSSLYGLWSAFHFFRSYRCLCPVLLFISFPNVTRHLVSYVLLFTCGKSRNSSFSPNTIINIIKFLLCLTDISLYNYEVCHPRCV